jgi:ABC-2 type transport system ATP-binding protein
LIEIINVTKYYGSHIAVKDLTFTVKKGEVMGFLGPNGAGKSTTMRIITGYMPPTRGRVLIDGIDVLKDPMRAKKRIGYLPESPPLYRDMTVKEYLLLVCDLKGIKGRKKEMETNRVIGISGLEQVTKRLIGNLSKGYKQRVGLAQALLGDPGILVLDEPTTGLDPKQIKEIRSLIKKLAGNKTVILSSHILPEVNAICEKIIIINKGRLVASGSADEISMRLQSRESIYVKAKGDFKKIANTLQKIKGMQSINQISDEAEVLEFNVEFEKGRDLREELFYAMAEMGCPILEMKPNKLSLEDVFVKLTTQEKVVETGEDLGSL